MSLGRYAVVRTVLLRHALFDDAQWHGGLCCVVIGCAGLQPDDSRAQPPRRRHLHVRSVRKNVQASGQPEAAQVKKNVINQPKQPRAPQHAAKPAIIQWEREQNDAH